MVRHPSGRKVNKYVDTILFAAEEFDPDRFLDERVKKYLIKNSFIFLPFNAGPRICLGQQVRHLTLLHFTDFL